MIGGGAAGFFSAINIAEVQPKLKILILEKSGKFLDKVRISGGGRCNVTHACWEPKELVKFYPRGNKELLGPFHRFMCGDMLNWLDQKGIETSIEEDGRIFPASNKSETIIDCFLGQAQKFNIELRTSEGLKNFELKDEICHIETTKDNFYTTKNLILTTGGSKSIWKLLESKDIKIVEPIPSLFTFNISHPIIQDLPGVSVESGIVKIKHNNLTTQGPVLITHWGLSGPGILKLSSWAARQLYQDDYKFNITVNWANISEEEAFKKIQKKKDSFGGEKISQDNLFKLPKRLWKNILLFLQIEQKNWADLNKKEMQTLCECVAACPFEVNGKSTNKDEFVTSGGVSLEQINFKTMELKNHPGLFLAGEILNIDALTGGFNFQAAWTTSWIISQNFI